MNRFRLFRFRARRQFILALPFFFFFSVDISSFGARDLKFLRNFHRGSGYSTFFSQDFQFILWLGRHCVFFPITAGKINTVFVSSYSPLSPSPFCLFFCFFEIDTGPHYRPRRVLTKMSVCFLSDPFMVISRCFECVVTFPFLPFWFSTIYPPLFFR